VAILSEALIEFDAILTTLASAGIDVRPPRVREAAARKAVEEVILRETGQVPSAADLEALVPAVLRHAKETP
jgi:hypothetical protein